MNPPLTLLLLSCVSFGVAFAFALWEVRTHGIRHTRWQFLFNLSGFLCQCGFLYYRGQELKHCPFTTPFELLVFLSWTVMCFYFITGPAFRISLLGFFTAPLVLVLQLGALFLLDPEPRPVNISPLLEWHATISLLSYGAFATNAVASLMYVIQDKLLKRHEIGSLFHLMPPLPALGKVVLRLLALGFLLCSAGVLTAFFLPERPSATKFGLTLAVWFVYGILCFAGFTHRLGPRSLALWSLLGFLLPLASLSILNER
jgi:HemX protein